MLNCQAVLCLHQLFDIRVKNPAAPLNQRVTHLPSLVFAYNATPHSTTGYQPYQLMFGWKAPALCDNWLGLGNYDDQRSISKTQWVDQQAEKLLAANKRAMRNIKADTAKNKWSMGIKDIDIPPGNLVLFQDHPERRNKILDLFKVIKKKENVQTIFGLNPLDLLVNLGR